MWISVAYTLAEMHVWPQVKLTNLIDLKPGDPVNVLPEPSTEQHSALHIGVRCDNRVAWAG